jgi:hypothetical protein
MLRQIPYKNLIAVILFCFYMLRLTAQIPPDYPPAPSPPGNINNIEYFFDSKPEFGSGTALTGFAPAVNISAFTGTVDLTGVTAGFHRIYFRSKDADGKWSQTNYAFFDNYNLPLYPAASPPPGNITYLEYFIDSKPEFGSGTPIPISPSPNIAGLIANINITGLLQGVHRLYVRSKDVNGKWSITNFSVFDNSSVAPYPSAQPAAPAIDRMEYYIDSDPGFGNATAISVPGNTGDINNYSVNLALSGSLTIGTHYLYIRSKQNPWSISNVVAFNASSTLPVSWLYVKALLNDNNGIISWATGSEQNTERFELEHSTDAIHFTKIGTVAAAGNSSTDLHYSFTHTGLPQGMNYYRIKQLDIDGNYKYSMVVVLLKRNGLRNTIIAPNPVSDMLHIIEPSQIRLLVAEVYSSNGSLLLQKTINSNGQVNSLPVKNLPKGVYHLVLKYEKNEVKTFSFVKQ